MKQVTVEELKAKLDAGENVRLLDVREDYERQEFNIGGVHQRLGLIQMMETEPIDDWKEDEVVVYCRSGNRSANACMILQTLGFNNVANLKGGMLDWQAKFGNG